MQGNFKKQSHSKRQTRIRTKVTPEAPFFFFLALEVCQSFSHLQHRHFLAEPRQRELGSSRSRHSWGSTCVRKFLLFSAGWAAITALAVQLREQSGEMRCGGPGRQRAPGNNPNYAGLLPYRHLQEFLQGKEKPESAPFL